jgi:hypothetical protein
MGLSTMEVMRVRIGLAIVMGILAVVIATHWQQWMPHNPVLVISAALSFVVAIALGAYRIKFLEEKFGVLEIPVIWESEIVQAVSWDIVAYASIFSALVIGGVIASSMAPMLPLSLLPLAYIVCILLIGVIRWGLSVVMATVITR